MKAFTAIFLALIITLSLAGCGAAPAEPAAAVSRPTIPEITAATEDPRVAAYGAALSLLEEGSYDRAKEAFLNLGSYSDAETQAKECDYRKAAALLAAGENRAAWELYGQISGYKDADTLREGCRFALMETFVRYEMDGVYYGEATYHYEDGRLTREEYSYDPDHPRYSELYARSRYEHTYDGNTVTVYAYDEKDSLFEIQIWIYDENHCNTMQSFIYVDDPESNYTYKFTSDEQGRIIEALYYDNGTGEGSAAYKYTYEYDEYGNQTAEKNYKWENVNRYSDAYDWKELYAVYYEYGIDDNGKVQWVTDSDTGGTREYTYNSRGLVETEVFTTPDYYRSIRYTYDDSGNEIMRQVYTDNNGVESEYIVRGTYEPVELFPGEAAPETTDETKGEE